MILVGKFSVYVALISFLSSFSEIFLSTIDKLLRSLIFLFKPDHFSFVEFFKELSIKYFPFIAIPLITSKNKSKRFT